MGRSGNGRPQNRDDDLLLFRELRRREKERIATLLQPVSGDFDPQTTNSLFRISKPSSTGYDLSIDKDKSDFNWLKTPPATPLFPSLEMEANSPELVVQRQLPIHPPLSRFAGGGNNKGRPKTPNSTPGLPPGPTNSHEKSKPNPAKHNNFISSNLATKPDATLNTRNISKAAAELDKAPPNLRTDRPASATRGRPKKPEPKVMARRQSCSPAVVRGRRGHDQPPDKSGKPMNQVMGSRMVDKLMSGRKSSTGSIEDHKESIKSTPKSLRSADNSNVFNQTDQMKRERNYNPGHLGVFSNR